MANYLITFLQALQLVALGPCLFVIFFLMVTSRNWVRIIIPVGYFLCLACSFALPLLSLFHIEKTDGTFALFLIGETLIPAFCYLLILQFIYGKTPSIWYWFILALPIIGGGPFIYSAIHLDEFCIMNQYCLETDSMKRLYAIFSASLIFLLLLAHYASRGSDQLQQDPERSSKFWLIMALIMLSLQLMVVDLAALANMVKESSAIMIATLIRIAFIFLVLTSLFRVFGRTLEIAEERIPNFIPPGRKPLDMGPLIARLEAAMMEEKLYRHMGINREALAHKLAMPEHVLSRIINSHFDKNFSEYMNQFRVEEAKSRLQKEETPITTIAFEVGFNSIASFNRVFREMTGMSPSQFRAGKPMERA